MCLLCTIAMIGYLYLPIILYGSLFLQYLALCIYMGTLLYCVSLLILHKVLSHKIQTKENVMCSVIGIAQRGAAGDRVPSLLF